MASITARACSTHASQLVVVAGAEAVSSGGPSSRRCLAGGHLGSSRWVNGVCEGPAARAVRAGGPMNGLRSDGIRENSILKKPSWWSSLSRGGKWLIGAVVSAVISVAVSVPLTGVLGGNPPQTSSTTTTGVSSPQPARVSLRAYVHAVCAAIAPFQRTVESRSSALDLSGIRVPANGKQALQSFLTGGSRGCENRPDQTSCGGGTCFHERGHDCRIRREHFHRTQARTR